MKTAIVGSRTIEIVDLNKVLSFIPENCTELVSGGARGVDSIAHKLSIKLDIPLTVFRPDYDKYGRIAPLKRNELIAQYCDMMIAVWDYQSSGTRKALDYAIKLGKPVKICMVHNNGVQMK